MYAHLCFQRPDRFNAGGVNSAAITPCDRSWHGPDLNRCPNCVCFRGVERTWRREVAASANDPGCVKTCTSQECAELFSLSSSLSGGRKHFWFSNLRNPDGISTRRLNVGVFTRPRPKGEVAGYSMTSSASASIVGGMSRPRALAVASGDKDVAFSNSSSKYDPSQSCPSPRVGHSTKKHLACRLGLWGTCV